MKRPNFHHPSDAEGSRGPTSPPRGGRAGGPAFGALVLAVVLHACSPTARQAPTAPVPSDDIVHADADPGADSSAFTPSPDSAFPPDSASPLGDGGPDWDDLSALDASESDLGPVSDAVTWDVGGDSLSEPTDVATDTQGPATPASADEQLAVLMGADLEAAHQLVGQWDGPVCDSDGCLVATRAPGASSVAVLGEFSGWTDAGAVQLKLASAAPEWFAGLVPPVDVPTPYKLKIDQEWAPDISNPYVLFGGFGFDNALTPHDHGRLRWLQGIASPELGNTRSAYVYLPAPYFTSPEARFPVLYLQDGFNVFANPNAPFGSWDVEVTLDQEIAAGRVAPLIVVAVDTEDRLSEYTYAPIETRGGPSVPKAALYAQFLAATLKPLIDAELRTKPDPAATAVGGSSLGGIISLYTAWAHPGVFGRAASFSGAFWVGESAVGEASGPSMRELIEAGGGPSQSQLIIYLDAGDTHEDGTTSYSADGWALTDWTRNALIRKGWPNNASWDTDANSSTPPSDLPLGTAPGAVPHIAWEPALVPPASSLHSVIGHGHRHNEAAWRARFAHCARFLFPAAPPFP